jgi:CDGSH-type Zn-finger protein
MSATHDNPSGSDKKIVIRKNGPYRVLGNIPLVQKTQIVSEYGEPLTWKLEGELETTPEDYVLCRCGQSSCRPFCDGTHRKKGFDGTETADTGLSQDRRVAFQGGTRLVVKKDTSICMDSGFCGMRNGDLAKFVSGTNDTQVRSLVIAMVERCPSGALSYHIEAGDPDIEPDLPAQIADTTEITSDGPIAGPLWVTGNILIERSDGQPMETRNRVTLCNCGLSRNKPLCDGAHRLEAQRLARRRNLASKFR